MKGEHGCLLILAAVIAIDLGAAEEETLTDAIHRLKARHPLIVWTAVMATALHFLAGDHPTLSRYDAYRALGWARQRTRFT
ncbi:DUF7427 family protein [Nocardia grenadensis]|uniref:DUF7427 family protein n=1 Tax=Nocardia grenadensis TaxID=931537 RepID=UPI0007A4F6CB|nr:hypothetical protein [Nocardia grenadensis]